SSFTERTYIYRSYPRIEYEMEVHWLETGTDSTDSPMLRAHFPLAFDAPRLFCQVPFDVVERPANGSFRGGAVPKHLTSQSNVYGVEPEKGDGQEVPAQKWVDVTDGESGIALLNKTKYGHSYHDGELRLTLMRAAGSPDIYPNLGKFVIRYALFPHVGDWKSGVWMEGDDYNVPVLAAEPPSLALGRDHATQPEEQSFFSVSESNVAITGIKQSEEGDELIVRLVETEGRATSVTVQLPVAATAVRRLNLIEMPLQGAAAPVSKGSAFTVGLKPHEIATIGIRPR
ncbi:glycoside hydrolase family 38 C-terminal domain-containing protein, partial [Petrimonas mucosa]